MGIPYALKANVLLLLVVHPGWHTVAGQCISSEDLPEVSGCCRQQPFLPDDIVQNCLKVTIGKGNLKSDERLACIVSCTYDALGLINAAGEVNSEKYIASMALQDGPMREVVTDAVNSCDNISADIKRSIANTRSSCNLFPIMYHMCVSQFTVTNCPAEHWTESPICAQVKSGVPLC